MFERHVDTFWAGRRWGKTVFFFSFEKHGFELDMILFHHAFSVRLMFFKTLFKAVPWVRPENILVALKRDI